MRILRNQHKLQQVMRTNLEQNTTYKAQIVLGALQSMAGNNVVADKLKEVGFTFVTVTGSGSKREAKGKWAKPTQEVEVPEQIKEIEKA